MSVDWSDFNGSRFFGDSATPVPVSEAFELANMAAQTHGASAPEPLATERTAMAILEEMRAVRAALDRLNQDADFRAASLR